MTFRLRLKESFRSTVDKELSAAGARDSQLIKSSLVTLALIGGLVVGTSICLIKISGLSLTTAAFSVATYFLSSVFVLTKLNHYPHAHFGAANTTTAIRAGLT